MKAENHVYSISCGLGVAFLIETPHGLYLIDSGSPGHQDRILAKMNALGRRDLKLIWITHAHYDHYGSAAALRVLTGALIGVHPADTDYMIAGRSPTGSTRSYGFIYPIAQQVVGSIRPLLATLPDFVLDDGETLEQYGLNASVLFTPGHTPGHTCLLLEGGIAFAGDLISRSSGIKQQYLLATDWNQLPRSVAKLKAAQPEWIYTGHSRYHISGEELQGIKA